MYDERLEEPGERLEKEPTVVKVLETIYNIYKTTPDWELRYAAIIELPGGIGDIVKKNYELTTIVGEYSYQKELEQLVAMLEHLKGCSE